MKCLITIVGMYSIHIVSYRNVRFPEYIYYLNSNYYEIQGVSNIFSFKLVTQDRFISPKRMFFEHPI